MEKLNQTIYQQQQQIEFLYRELKAIKEQGGNEGGATSDNRLLDDIPPHY